MGISLAKSTYSGRVPEIWRGECKVLPGGFAASQDFTTGTVIKRGTPIKVEFDGMTAAVCKTGTALSGSTTSVIRVDKGTLFVAGDIVAIAGDYSESATISSVDTSNDDYDELTLSAELTALEEGDIIVLASEDGTAAAYVPNAVAAADAIVSDKGILAIDAAYEAVVLAPSLDFPIPDEWLAGGIALADNHSIKFISQ